MLAIMFTAILVLCGIVWVSLEKHEIALMRDIDSERKDSFDYEHAIVVF